MSYELRVSTPLGGIAKMGQYLSGVDINLGGHEINADLIILAMSDFDVILGMDWLSKHYATIHCKDRKVEFFQSGLRRVVLHGVRDPNHRPIVSAMGVNKIIQNGGYAILYHLEVPSKLTIDLTDIEVAREFTEMF